MSEESKNILIKRVKSFLWRFSMLFIAGVIDFTLQNLGLFNLPPLVTLILGLTLGEVSKTLNTRKALLLPS